jgi:iron(III) transport system substrate-binding protein
LSITLKSVTFVVICSLTINGCKYMTKARERPITGQLSMYVDPDSHTTWGVLWYFIKERRIDVKQWQDPSRASAIKRLTNEADHPQADLYWADDPVNCEVLRKRGLTVPLTVKTDVPMKYRDPEFNWTGFAGRLRVLLVRRSIPVPERPQSIRAYTDPAWRGKGAIAEPLTGSTRSHFAALATVWGNRQTASFYAALRKNGTRITKTSGEAADLVASGQADFALVDTDVALPLQQKGLPVEIVYPDQGEDDPGVMLVPNAIAVIKGCKHLDAVKALIEYVASLEGERRVMMSSPFEVALQTMVASGSVYIRRPGSLKLMPVDYRAQVEKFLNLESILGAHEVDSGPTSEASRVSDSH